MLVVGYLLVLAALVMGTVVFLVWREGPTETW